MSTLSIRRLLEIQNQTVGFAELVAAFRCIFPKKETSVTKLKKMMLRAGEFINLGSMLENGFIAGKEKMLHITAESEQRIRAKVNAIPIKFESGPPLPPKRCQQQYPGIMCASFSTGRLYDQDPTRAHKEPPLSASRISVFRRLSAMRTAVPDRQA